MKKITTILLSLFCLFTLMSCTKTKKDDNTKPTQATVQNAIDKMKEVENFRAELVLNANDNEVSVIFSVDDDIKKIELSLQNFNFVFYISPKTNIDTNEEELYLIVNYNMFAPNEPAKWAEIPLSYEETSTDPEPSEIPAEYTEIIESVQLLLGFFEDLKDEYFTLDEDKYFVFNETGKTAFKEVLKTFIESVEELSKNPTDVNLDDLVDYNIKIKTNNDYITVFKAEILPENEQQKITLIVNFDRYNEVEITIPSSIMNWEDFKEFLIQELKLVLKVYQEILKENFVVSQDVIDKINDGTITNEELLELLKTIIEQVSVKAPSQAKPQ